MDKISMAKQIRDTEFQRNEIQINGKINKSADIHICGSPYLIA